MERLLFTPDLVIGIEKIDSQHKELISRISKFLETIVSQNKNIILSDVRN